MEGIQGDIREAVKKRKIDFEAEIQTITLKRCRRLLEQDMGLQPGGLDDNKDYVKQLIETLVVNPEPEAKPAQEAAKPAAAKVAKKRTASDAQGKKSKQVEAKQTAAKEYGPKVQRLKRVCKAATIIVPPSVYARVTSEQDVVTRLKDLLSKHGLAKDSSPEDIARVKRTLKKERDLDGIDTGNIVQSSRSRRPRVIPHAYSAVAASGSDEDDDEDVPGNENAKPDNGEDSTSGDCKAPNVVDKPGIAGEPEVKCRLLVHTAPGNESKAKAAGKPPKRLAEWSESEDD
ncbi:hypothetical protein CVIRNUC_011141 [Coccomyxa viridis]|uniref:Histone chaperone domain-containing protein n=1 Tax=Coccomyxa viridis TaxID=1274662 RepID=A0AAV1IKS5_9CHLO|nr:hypothetical protein CVIRNUC_011141 [Coccomyxa viridis]